jgi:hypothetical protein
LPQASEGLRCQSTTFGHHSQADMEHLPWAFAANAAPESGERRLLEADNVGPAVLGVEVRGFEPLASSVRDLYRAFLHGIALC